MKKSGFTLAEVLITLGIIGVVAALTAPALVMQSRNEANAAKLSVAVSNLENAFTTAITQENVDNLYQTGMWLAENNAGFVGNLKRYLNVADFSDTSAQSYYANNGGAFALTNTGAKGAEVTNEGPFSSESNMTIETKQGYVIFMLRRNAINGIMDNTPKIGNNVKENEIIDLGGGMLNRAAIVMIDVNGTGAPNTLGRDIFLFALGKNGILYPRGGVDYSIFSTGAANSIWSSNDGNTGCTAGGSTKGYGCAGRVIAEGYKINY